MATMTAAPQRRRLSHTVVQWGIVLGIVGAVVGFWVGALIGDRVVPADANSNNSNAALIVAYIGSAIGFLAGMGFFQYPIGRLLGRPRPTEADEAFLYGEDGGKRRYFRLNLDHKVIGVQYLVVILFFLFAGGLGAMFIRAELMATQPSFTSAESYLEIVGLHSVLMIFMASAAIIGPFGNYFVPIMIGSRGMAFPRLEALTFWLLPPAALILISSVLVGGFPTGWTGYAPLADEAVRGMDAYLVAFGLVGLSICLSGLNMIATVISQRAPGLRMTQLSVLVWGVFVTSFLGLLAAPVLLVVLVMEMLDRIGRATFFVPAAGGSPFLWENLFWFFGHPEVYIFIIPAFGLILEMLPVFARKPIWGYRVALGGMIGVGVLSFFVWQHHLFVSGIAPSLRPFYMFSTEAISIPTSIIFLVAIGTLWRCRARFTVPMLFVLGFMFNFLIGGFTGVFLSDVPTDFSLHASYFVQAHFHYTIMGAEVFALVGGITYYLPRITGHELNERVGKIQFWVMFIGFNGTFLSLLAVGILGMPRRVVSYDISLQGLNISASLFSFVLGASMLAFLVMLVYDTIVKPRLPRSANPWESLGNEWRLPHPIPVHNFTALPTDWRLPYDYDRDDTHPALRGAGAPFPGLAE
ncbi:MAG: cbb3-type cytochrome c oxidase subunit I [Candidatus Dormibacteraeota bacterium]|uniref:Cbb3-type cytochrome c oxidase subunit I n=1 Tax=Candidatus Amunia macphersoniae TaxID=3127014 RepID=A0A934KFW3_9BACT|nr:cbb3-type cytochrome c oxidase subunit I [Candidatus Dormibacteraeota bacterium]